VVKHENVMNLPIFNETLLISKAPGSNQKRWVGVEEASDEEDVLKEDEDEDEDSDEDEDDH
jgi:hypothetical protein